MDLSFDIIVRVSFEMNSYKHAVEVRQFGKPLHQFELVSEHHWDVCGIAQKISSINKIDTWMMDRYVDGYTVYIPYSDSIMCIYDRCIDDIIQYIEYIDSTMVYVYMRVIRGEELYMSLHYEMMIGIENSIVQDRNDTYERTYIWSIVCRVYRILWMYDHILVHLKDDSIDSVYKDMRGVIDRCIYVHHHTHQVDHVHEKRTLYDSIIRIIRGLHLVGMDDIDERIQNIKDTLDNSNNGMVVVEENRVTLENNTIHDVLHGTTRKSGERVHNTLYNKIIEYIRYNHIDTIHFDSSGVVSKSGKKKSSTGRNIVRYRDSDIYTIQHNCTYSYTVHDDRYDHVCVATMMVDNMMDRIILYDYTDGMKCIHHVDMYDRAGLFRPLIDVINICDTKRFVYYSINDQDNNIGRLRVYRIDKQLLYINDAPTLPSPVIVYDYVHMRGIEDNIVYNIMYGIHRDSMIIVIGKNIYNDEGVIGYKCMVSLVDTSKSQHVPYDKIIGENYDISDHMMDDIDEGLNKPTTCILKVDMYRDIAFILVEDRYMNDGALYVRRIVLLSYKKSIIRWIGSKKVSRMYSYDRGSNTYYMCALPNCKRLPLVVYISHDLRYLLIGVGAGHDMVVARDGEELKLYKDGIGKGLSSDDGLVFRTLHNKAIEHDKRGKVVRIGCQRDMRQTSDSYTFIFEFSLKF